MSWISGPCSEEPDEQDERDLERRQPRAIWPQATHFAGIVDTVNPGHWVPKAGVVDPTDQDGAPGA